MDYILFGAGTGASLAVIGWILREWGPRLRDGKTDDGIIHSASELIDRMSWARFCASCGMAMVVAGTLILLATAIVAVWNPGDDLAAWILIGTYLFVSLLMLVWAFLYTRQFGTGGIYRPVTIEPVTETREAVPVLPRDSEVAVEDSAEPETTDVPVETSASPAETTDTPPDVAEVAARRGGLSRFASFFNRPRPADRSPEDEVDDADLDADGGDTAAERSTDEDRVDSEIQETEVITESSEDAGTVIEIVEGDVSEVIPTAEAANGESDPDVTETGDAADPIAPTMDEPAIDRSHAESIEAPLPAATPEDDALAELRRRRLARLSGNNH